MEEYVVFALVILWTMVGPLAFHRWIQRRSLRLLNAHVADNPVPPWQIIIAMVLAGPGTWILVFISTLTGREDND